jgi:hypothetical protein
MSARLTAAALVTAVLPLTAGLLLASQHHPVSASGTVQTASAQVASTLAADSSTRRIIGVDSRVKGRSGALRVAVVRALDALDLPFISKEETADGSSYRWVPLFGTREERLAGEARVAHGLQAPMNAGIWQLLLRNGDWTEEVKDLAVITQMPFAAKRNGFLNGYHIGLYPTEASDRVDRYAPPVGFIEVTPENKDVYVSEHFRLGQFLTKDQFNVWPKYVALDLRLIDKLELVLQELNAMGIRAERMHVMSGFRTPQYNGPGEGGRAKLSRHTYGDAADVWVDNDGDGYIDDLNGDGRRDIEDAKLMMRAVDRVEKRHPELIGGAGLYLENSAHGPFIHIDVRGTHARW